jgi:hypothetical protein
MVKFKHPKTIGACADRLYQLRQKRLEMQKAVDAVEAEERSLRSYVIEVLPKSNASGVAGKIARVTVITKTIPQVNDWPKFYKHILKTKQFELMQRRVADSAIQERWELGKKVPGVEPFNVVTVSLNKV